MADLTLPRLTATGLEDDMRPRMFEAAAAGNAFALATIIAADGGPRPVGAQMVITQHDAWGFLSGGCIEADVALHGRQVLIDGDPRTLVYGRGSPFVDMRLPCGGRIDVLIERVQADDAAVARLRAMSAARMPALWSSDGRKRSCTPLDDQVHALAGAALRRPYSPRQRLAVAGTDAFALAIAALGATIGWEAILLSPAVSTGAPAGVRIESAPIVEALATIAPDPWTAIAIATHDADADREALVQALRSGAGYVGVLGSQRRIPERLAALRAAGLDDAQIARLHAPIGLPIRASSPWEVAVAVVGEVIALREGHANSARPATA